MGCGCVGRNLEYASNYDFQNKIRKIAKNMAMDEGVWYVIIKCGGGNFDFIREKDFRGEGRATIVEYVSPV